ncbi:hypothetical protein Sjap_026227 [Stephania japonica]|uniref:GRF-type domain-containing protein n=1 Tax=Stephania japonica TaxID=461633 RepID=A0AAP0HIP0_9MAGN
MFSIYQMPTISSTSCNSGSYGIGKSFSSHAKLCRKLPHATRIDKKYIVLEREVMCHCSRPYVVKTSWTCAYPGRRFYACVRGRRRGGCDYFLWMNDKSTNYVTCILNNLVGTISNLLEERTSHVDVDEVIKLRAENNLLRSKVVKLYQELEALNMRCFVLKLIVLGAIRWCIWVLSQK